jgi:hypothetical protein
VVATNPTALAKRLSGRLKYPVATVEDALAQLGTSHTGVALRRPATKTAVVPGAAPAPAPTLDSDPAERTALQSKYFPLKSEADLQRALAAEVGNLRPVGTWVKSKAV